MALDRFKHAGAPLLVAPRLARVQRRSLSGKQAVDLGVHAPQAVHAVRHSLQVALEARVARSFCRREAPVPLLRRSRLVGSVLRGGGGASGAVLGQTRRAAARSLTAPANR